MKGVNHAQCKATGSWSLSNVNKTYELQDVIKSNNGIFGHPLLNVSNVTSCSVVLKTPLFGTLER